MSTYLLVQNHYGHGVWSSCNWQSALQHFFFFLVSLYVCTCEVLKTIFFCCEQLSCILKSYWILPLTLITEILVFNLKQALIRILQAGRHISVKCYTDFLNDRNSKHTYRHFWLKFVGKHNIFQMSITSNVPQIVVCNKNCRCIFYREIPCFWKI